MPGARYRVRNMVRNKVWSLAALLLLASVTAYGGEAAAPVVADDFALLDHRGRFHRLSRESDAKAIVIYAFGVGCPIVRATAPDLVAWAHRSAAAGVRVWLLDANPQDDRTAIATEAEAFGIDLPILVDEAQLVAASLGFVRTNEAVLIEPASRRIVWRGTFDDAIGNDGRGAAATWPALPTAVDEFLAGRPPAPATPAKGCMIAYRDARAPDASESPQYARDIVPILRRRCVECHRPGAVGPWAMTSHAKVSGWSETIREVVRTRRMPPWDADPAHGRFVNDGGLTVDEQRALVRWIEAGSPAGDAGDPLASDPPPPSPVWPLGEPDLVIELPVQAVPAAGMIPYREVPLRLDLPADTWVRAIDVRPSEPEAMHHALIFTGPAGEPPRTGIDGFLGSYVPGTEVRSFPDGTGQLLRGGSQLNAQLHYTASGRACVDRPRIGLYFHAARPARELRYVALVDNVFVIPPGVREHPVEAATTAPRDLVLHGMSPHMHVRGARMAFTLRRPDGVVETLLSVPCYRFAWQRTYLLAEPIPIPAGSVITAQGAFDNSAGNEANPDPTLEVRWGQQSWEEMFVGYVMISTP